MDELKDSILFYLNSYNIYIDDDMRNIIIGIFIGLLIMLIYLNYEKNKNLKIEKLEQKKREALEVEEITPRNWTLDQLRKYNGQEQNEYLEKLNEKLLKLNKNDEKYHNLLNEINEKKQLLDNEELIGENRNILVCILNEVYDVSAGRQFYGANGFYNCFAGRDASRALAKLSFEEEDLANPNVDDLLPGEKDKLDEWIQKYKYYKNYPIVGKIIKTKYFEYTLNDLSLFIGKPIEQDKKEEKIDENDKFFPLKDTNRIHPPIYVSIKGNIYDVSFGGWEFYSPCNQYHLFAGKDVSISLAKLSFEEKYFNQNILSKLNEKENKILDDWEDKFKNIKKYPIVGKLIDF